jgi:hypothetical protein
MKKVNKGFNGRREEICPLCKQVKTSKQFTRENYVCKECQVKMDMMGNQWWINGKDVLGRIQHLADYMIEHSRILGSDDLPEFKSTQNIQLVGHAMRGLLYLFNCASNHTNIFQVIDYRLKNRIELAITDYYNAMALFTNVSGNRLSSAELRVYQDGVGINEPIDKL